MEKLLTPLYCIIARYDLDSSLISIIEEKFNILLKNFLDSDDINKVAMFELDKEAIYLMNISKFKVSKIVEFFSKNKLLISFEEVSNKIFDIVSNERFLGFYDDDYNKKIIDNYILENMTIDNILDRINEVGYDKITQIEMKILNQSN